MGDRARLNGLNLRGLQRRGFDVAEIQAMRQGYAFLFGSEGTFAERVEAAAERYAALKPMMEIIDFIRADSKPRTGPTPKRGMAPKLGIIAGSGTLPAGKLVEKCRETGRDCFVLALEDETDPATVDGVDHLWSRMGAAGARTFACSCAAGRSSRELVMVGGVRRPSLAGLRPDWRAAQFFARIGLRALGDDGLLSALVKELEREGFTLVGVRYRAERCGGARKGHSAGSKPDASGAGRYRAWLPGRRRPWAPWISARP